MSTFQLDEVANIPYLMLLLRQTPSWRGLCEHLGIDPYGEYGTITSSLLANIVRLREIGVLEFQGNPQADHPEHDELPFATLDEHPEPSLGLSLHDLAKVAATEEGWRLSRCLVDFHR